MQSRRWWALGAAALMVGAGLGACRGRRTTNITIEQALFATRADAIALPVSASWHEPMMSAINPARTEDNSSSHYRFFYARDGAGILAFMDGSALYLSYFGGTGPIGQPVLTSSDFQFDSAALQSLFVLWTPAGDAIIAFRAVQADSQDGTFTGTGAKDRIYYTTFRRSLAAVSRAGSGEEFGFDTWPVTIDSRVTSADTSQATGIFLSTDLIDGTLNCASMATPDPFPVSGAAGDPASLSGKHFFLLGWLSGSSTTTPRIAGTFFDIDSSSAGYLAPQALETVSTVPALATNEAPSTTVLASGRDLLFRWKQQNGPTRLNLARVNAARDGFETSIDIARPGTTSSSSATIDTVLLMGDGYRSLNGQTATWLCFTQNYFENSSTVSQNDEDLVIARVDDAGDVQIDEFDHNSATSTDPNNVTLKAWLVGRGASRALLLYTQTEDPASQAIADNRSLFARAVYFDGSGASSTFAHLISDEVRVNQTIDTTSTAPNNVDVQSVWTAALDPFCGPQHNNDAFYVAFSQDLEATATRTALRTARLEVTVPSDISASGSQISLAATESTIESSLDTNWSATLQGVALTEAGSADSAVVFYGANGNNAGNKAATGSFEEVRVFAWANALPDATGSAPVLSGTEVSSHATNLPRTWHQVQGYDWMVKATPSSPASRDYALDTDTASVELAHLILSELNETVSLGVLRGRALDLRAGVSSDPAGRFFPSAGDEPQVITTERNYDVYSPDTTLPWSMLNVVADGNALVAVFVERASNESSASRKLEGQVFVNAFSSAGRTWSDASLLSNAFRPPIQSDGDGGSWLKIGSGARSGCSVAVGSWVLWPKAISGEADHHVEFPIFVQGRRLTGTDLPRR